MSPMVITLALFAAIVAGCTVAGGAILLALAKPVRANTDPARAFGAAFGASFVGALVYMIVLKIMDKTDQDLMNTAFIAAAAAGVIVAFVPLMKSVDVEPNKIPILWIPLAACLAAGFYLSRTMGQEWREKNGFYRGFEGVASLNMLDPPDAMSTPEKAVNYYNSQYKKLREANEDEGIGKLLTTGTHWDAKWFNENFGYITHNMGKSDPFGITQVVQDPKQHKVMALAQIARPIYGKVQDVKENGDEALVLMSSGQLVRLHREGKNWKVRDWLGMRPLVMKEIYEQKEKDGKATDEDRAAKDKNFTQYEEDTKAMASAAGFPYKPYEQFMYEDEDEKKTTGYAALDQAKPGELVDLQQQQKATPTPAGGQATAAVGPTAGAANAAQQQQLSVQQKLALLNNQMDAQVASMNGQATPVGAVTIQQGNDPNAWQKAAQAQGIIPAPAQQSGPVPILTGVPVENLWPALFQAIAKVERGDASGIQEMLRCFSSDDVTWFQRNYQVIADLVTPGTQYTPEQAQLVALQALARSMPHAASGTPTTRIRGASGAAKVVDSSNQNATYTTLIAQENGRWVLVQPFFARTFVWQPQIAVAKQARGQALAPDEQSLLSTGITPMQQQVRQTFQQLGFSL